MKRRVSRAVLTLKCSEVGINIGAARHVYRLGDRVCKERRLTDVSAFTKVSKPARLKISDNASMQVIGLYLSRHDTDRRDRAAYVLREARHIVDDLVDAPS